MFYNIHVMLYYIIYAIEVQELLFKKIGSLLECFEKGTISSTTMSRTTEAI